MAPYDGGREPISWRSVKIYMAMTLVISRFAVAVSAPRLEDRGGADHGGKLNQGQRHKPGRTAMTTASIKLHRTAVGCLTGGLLQPASKARFLSG